MRNYTFLKSPAKSNMQKYLQNLKKMCKFSLQASVQKSMENFFAKTVQFLLHFFSLAYLK